ncbi:ABC transporter substrate-binding protein [Pseudonocardia sp.]|uniref:ABC transporter substrate-binding protein n=1 Tax=Pseudonocardia sp. TaxID=60912 RepID=UPI002628591B|nr:ABC transporter substrate-binding protein [Pseudonocardia sp.]
MSAPTSRRTPRTVAVTSGAIALGLVLAACGGSPAADGGGGGQAAGGPECAAYTQYGDLSGTTVSVYTSIVAPEDQSHIDSYDAFENCTGATIEYEGSREFEAQLQVRISGGNAPDLAYIPQPGLLSTLVQDTGSVVAVPQAAAANVDQYFPETYREAGSVDGTLYATPLGANVKSYVWYSPQQFTERGYTVPTTWDEMIALSDSIAAEGNTPWCAGIESGDATGWPLTDFTEDAMLRTAGPDVYDQWVAHEIPFNDPQVATALDRVGSILKNPAYVGDVTAIATTSFGDAGLPILDGACFMHRQANFYAANWPEGTDVSENGEVFAFPLPPIDPALGETILVGGEFVAAFADRPEVQAFQAYLSSPEWANEKAKATTALEQTGWISANTGLDTANLLSPIDVNSVEILQDPENEFRFDGSDLMPGAVGSGTFWTAMTNWVTGASTADALNLVESSWPQ